MPYTLTMPKLSPTMEQGTLVKWHKQVGDEVKVDDLLMEVGTDKATVEFNAIDKGWMRKILIQEGQDAIVNQAVAIMTESREESIEGYKPEGATKPAPPPPLAAEAPAKTTAAEAEPMVVQRPVASAPKSTFVPEPPLKMAGSVTPSEGIGNRLLSSPLARRLAKEKGLDLSTLKGSGPGGRIMSRDLENAQPSGIASFGRRELPKIAPGTYEEEPLSQIRRVVGQRLQEAKSYIPHFYVSQSCQAEALVNIREQLHNMGVKLSYNDFVVRACALALRQHPHVNSGFNSSQNTLIRFKTIDISVAVSIDEGLITPIVRYADYKNLGELSAEIRALAKRAKEGKLDAQEYKGGSFTISNLGMYGVTDFQAIINPPQAAILAVSGIQQVPVVKKGEVIPGQVMNISLSVDHRVIDGVLAAEFIKTVQKFIENPAALLI